MRSFTDIFVKHPVLAVVVNLVIILAGWRALTSLPVQQYPQIESSSVIITTIYYGASAETVRGFLSTPIEREVFLAAVTELLNHPDRLPAMGERGTRLIRERFTLERQVEQTITLYRALIGRSR